MKRLAFVVCGWLVIGVTALVLAAGPEAGVTVQLFKFRPDRLEVKTGTRVTWTNQDDIVHTVTSDAFDLRLAGKGATASHEFTRPGVFPYACARHPAMRGEIHVN